MATIEKLIENKALLIMRKGSRLDFGRDVYPRTSWAGSNAIAYNAAKEMGEYIATEQDRIARKEERERCIKAAENYLLNLWKEDDCDTTSIGFTLNELRKAIEEGGEQ